MMITTRTKERGAALIETAITIPIILLVSVSIFEFGRAYQTWQVLTNAVREGARVSIILGKTDDQVTAAVRNYMDIGGLKLAKSSSVTIALNRNVTVGGNSSSEITVQYPYTFMVLNPVIKLVTPSSKTGEPITMSAKAVMRNEN
jgi:Flp pilus assembly protein TadG